MKILFFSDVHWNTYSSIVRKRGDIYSERLEHLIDSMNWVNEQAVAHNCDAMICAGDFFDKAQATDEEITALREIKWNDKTCYFLCGNHESSVADLRFSTLKALEADNHIIVSEPLIWKFNNDADEIRFLPYVTESDRKPLAEYFGKGLGKTIVVSHNEIQGINYGGFESKLGFSIKEIEENCDLFLNGHLHNTEWVTKKILNVGSFSAHNFTNDSTRYKYGAWILDTDTMKMEFLENPYGFYFYKLDILSEADLSQLAKIKNKAVVNIKTTKELIESVKNALEDKTGLIETKITIERRFQESDGGTVDISALTTDHLQKFIEFCRANIANGKVLEDELAEICK